MKQLPQPADIIALLLKYKRLSVHELQYHLAIGKGEEADFKRILKKMVTQKEIKIEADNIVKLLKSARLCHYQAGKDGKGGIAIDIKNKDQIIIPVNGENYALDGDEVAVMNDGVDKQGRPQGIIREIIKRKITNLVGRIEQYKDKYYLVSDNPHLGHYPVVIDGVNQVVAFDEIYNCVVSSYPHAEQSYFKVKIVNSIGKLGDDEVFVNRVLIEANVPLEFSPETEKYVNRLPDQLFENEMVGREDLRALPFVTIDGEDARDFDDAVHCETNPDGSFTLSVAIADVAHYVKHGSHLDEDAFGRGTSIYFPRRVVPMLPEKLSNGLCSLNPNVDRLVMVCHMEVSPEGIITEYGVDNAIIHSHHRLTYNRVQRFLDNEEAIPEDITSNIKSLYAVFKALLAARVKRGAIDFEGSEPYFEFDDNGNISSLIPRERKEAHRLIEECMLAANVSVADFLSKNGHATLYRNHDRPSEKKFSALKSYLDSIGVAFDVTQETVRPKDYQALVERIKDRPNTAIIQQTILRSMQLAEYAPKNIGHFGLAYEKYLHFTSPIRRYPDLLVHRACKAVLNEKTYGYTHSIEMMGEQVSFTERRAEELERKVDSYYKCKYAQMHVGNEYSGIVTSVVSFGLFVTIPQLLIDGLVHVTELGGDYFVFDEKRHSLMGKNSGFKYVAGQELMVRIAAVDMDKLFIDLELTETNSIE